MFKAMYSASKKFCEDDCIATSWKKDLEGYIEQNEKTNNNEIE